MQLPEMVVHVDLEALTGEGGSCLTESGAVLAPSTAMRLACDAALVALIEDSEGKPLSVGRKTRVIPTALRRALDARDKGCMFPGCSHRRYLQRHHIQHWARGGNTDIENLVRLCPTHHRLVHEGGYSVRAGDGGFEFLRPDGSAVPPNLVGERGHPPKLRSVAPGAILSDWRGPMNLGYVINWLANPPDARGP